MTSTHGPFAEAAVTGFAIGFGGLVLFSLAGITLQSSSWSQKPAEFHLDAVGLVLGAAGVLAYGYGAGRGLVGRPGPGEPRGPLLAGAAVGGLCVGILVHLGSLLAVVIAAGHEAPPGGPFHAEPLRTVADGATFDAGAIVSALALWTVVVMIPASLCGAWLCALAARGPTRAA